MPRLDVIDLSHYNTPPDFAALKAAGLVGVIAKASEGATFKDDKYASFRSGALAAGLAFCSYHYLKHGNAAAQVDWWLSCANPVQGERMCIDYEDSSCTLDDLYGTIARLQAVRPDLEITIYSGNLIKEQLGLKYDPKLAPLSLWLAQYTSGTPSWPTGTWTNWTLWQYSDGVVGGEPKTMNGMKSQTDCNTFNGSSENCAKWLNPAAAPQPSPQPFPPSPISMEVVTGTVVIINGTAFVAP
jgi:lysozyme